MSTLHHFAACATTGILMSACSLSNCFGREWTSAAGTTIEADLVRVHLDNAILKKKDGKELVVPIAKLSLADQKFLSEQASTVATGGATDAKILKGLTGDLVRVVKGKVKKANFEQPAAIKYLAVYFSAHWCGPCRAFTPDLVEYYNQTKANHPEVEIVFVSSDRSEEEWTNYMLEENMPWYAVQYKKASSSKLKEYGGPGIPCLVLMTPDGEVLSDSYVDGQYVGPRKVVADLQALIEKDSPALTEASALGVAKP
ncbi:MAG: thioredoxin-like domain-containing protein [Verrucomicrobiales bacterium]